MFVFGEQMQLRWGELEITSKNIITSIGNLACFKVGKSQTEVELIRTWETDWSECALECVTTDKQTQFVFHHFAFFILVLKQNYAPIFFQEQYNK